MLQDEGYCKGITKSGTPCNNIAGASGYCRLHDPEKKAQEQAEQETAIRRAKDKENLVMQRRTEQLEQTQTVIQELQTQLKSYSENQRSHQLLKSVVDGLYIEIEKLTKKAPAEHVTELALGQINDAIRDTKQLLKDDPYIQKLTIFVPAGDMPQLRDTLIVLRQIKQGLERSNDSWDTRILTRRLSNATSLKYALELSLTGETGETILEKIKVHQSSYPSSESLFNIEFSYSDMPREWRTKKAGYSNTEVFNFEWLDSVDIPGYFRTQ